MLVINRDRWESTSPWASNVWTLMAECTYVYSWYEWLYYWRIDMRASGVEISFYRKRKCFYFFSFPKKEPLWFRLTVNLVDSSLRTTKRLRTDASSGVVKSVFRQSLSRSSSSVKLLAATLSFSCRCAVLHPTQCSELRRSNCCLSFVTQSVHFRYPRSCLTSNNSLRPG